MAGDASRENGKKGGRPKGSYKNPRFADYVSDEERDRFVEFVLSTYMGDMNLTKWVGDQLFGKAPQSLDVTSLGEKITKVQVEIVDGHVEPKSD